MPAILIGEGREGIDEVAEGLSMVPHLPTARVWEFARAGVCVAA